MSKLLLHLERDTEEQKCCSEFSEETNLLFRYMAAVLNISSWSAKLCSVSTLERNCKGDLQEFLTLINSILKTINQDVQHLLLFPQQRKKMQ